MQNSQISADLRDVFDSVKQLISNNAPNFSARPQKTEVSGEGLANAALAALASGNKNLVQLLQAIKVASGGALAPSAGQVSLVLDAAIEEGSIAAEVIDDRKVFSLTDAGVEKLAKLSSEQASAGAEAGANEDESSADAGTATTESLNADCATNIYSASAKLANAISGIAQSGSREQKQRAAALVDDLTRKLYKTLAED